MSRSCRLVGEKVAAIERQCTGAPEARKVAAGEIYPKVYEVLSEGRFSVRGSALYTSDAAGEGTPARSWASPGWPGCNLEDEEDEA